MADIRRIEVTQPPGPRMSRAVVHGDRVYLAGLTAADTSQDIRARRGRSWSASTITCARPAPRSRTS